MDDCVDELFKHIDFNEFFEEYWEKSPLHFSSVIDAPQNLISLASCEKQISICSQIKESIPCIIEKHIACPLSTSSQLNDPVGTAAAAFDRGCSILIPHLQKSNSVFASLCRQFDNLLLSSGTHLKKPTFSNVYITPPNSQGFGVHYDNHCVLVLQVTGTKRWLVSEPEYQLPIARCKTVLPDACLSNPCIDIELAPGDALYVPRGFPHAARSTDQTSLHITLGLSTVTWSRLISLAAERLEGFRCSVRPSTSDGTLAQQHLFKKLLPKLMQEDLTRLLLEMLGECLSDLPPVISETADRFNLGELSDNTALRRVRNVMVMPARQGESALLHFPGGPLALPLSNQNVLAFVADHEKFLISEIPNVSYEFDKLAFASLLLQKGIVSVDVN